MGVLNEIANRADVGNRIYGVIDGRDLESHEIELSRRVGAAKKLKRAEEVHRS